MEELVKLLDNRLEQYRKDEQLITTKEDESYLQGKIFELEEIIFIVNRIQRQ